MLRQARDAADDSAASGRDFGVTRRLAIVARIVAACFAIVAVWVGYVAVIQAGSLDTNAHNPRLIARGFGVQRGDIFTADGVRVAQSVPASASAAGGSVSWARRYPLGDKMAHVVGYYSIRYGAAGLERAYNGQLTGQQGFATFSDWLAQITGRRHVGNDLILTIDSRVQKAAVAALGSDRGACVALDPRTGAVLALATSPRFDPATVDNAWAQLATDPASPLLDRDIQGLYPPGSTMKIVTAAAVLKGGATATDTQWNGPAKMIIGGGRVANYGGHDYGTLSFADAFAKSVNTVFAQAGVKLGAERFVAATRSFGFDAAPPFPLTVRQSTIGDPAKMDPWELAWAAVGQPVRPRAHGGPLATPLEMALAGAAIANGGVMMDPYLVSQTRDYRGLVIARTAPRPWMTATEPQTASTVRDLMVRTVQQGTGVAAQISGVTVAGKTGTAEVTNATPHAWFVGFAPAENPRVVVAIIIEHGGVGGTVAAPRAREALKAALAATSH